MVKYKRIILKISGEALAGEAGFGIKPPVIAKIAQQIKEVHELGVQIAIVCGGGNIWRGETNAEMGMERAQADYMGMLATVMNALALQDNLESQVYRLGFRRQLRCGKSPNLIFGVKPFAIWRKGASLFSLAAPVTHTSALTRLQRYGQQKSALKLS